MADARGPVLWRGLIAIAVAIGTSGAPLAGVARAQQSFPNKTVRIVVPFSPGGTTDSLARLVAPKISESWGQSVVIENRNGAGSAIGASIVARATPDGHTLMLVSPAFAITAALNPNLPYDPLKDFSGVTQIGYSTSAIVVTPALDVKTLKEFIALAYAQPGKLFFGSAGAGTGTHMGAERFRFASGIKAVHVGFKGQPDFVIEIVAGRIHFGSSGLLVSLPFIRDGRLVALAVSIPQRSPLLPDVPAAPEVLPGWGRDGTHALLAPAGTPRPILHQVSKEIARTLSLPDIRERLQSLSYYIAPTTPEEHDRNLRADIATFSEVVKLAGLRPK